MDVGNLTIIKDVLVAVSAVIAVIAYVRSVIIQRGTNLMSLYNSFINSERYNKICDLLDDEDYKNLETMIERVKKDPAGRDKSLNSEFDDFLSFFEVVTRIKLNNETVFKYWLKQLAKNGKIIDYIKTPEYNFDNLAKVIELYK